MAIFTNTLKVVSAAGLLAVSAISQAAITPYSDDFEGYGTAGTPSVPDFTPWFGFSDNGGFPGGYTFNPSTTGPQISALGYNGTDNQFWVTYANYDNVNVHNRTLCDPCSPNLQEQISMFIEQPFTGADTASADTWVYKFNYALSDTAPPAGNTEVGAYIRVFDPIFNLLFEATFDTEADATAAFQPGRLAVNLDPAWVDGNIQFGVYNWAQEYENSGMFYDDVEWVKADPASLAIRQTNYGDVLHPHHTGQMLTNGSLPDDEIRVLIYGQSTGAGDPFNFNADNVVPSTLRIGPSQGPVKSSPPSDFGGDYDSDGQNDSRHFFNMSESGFECSSTDGLVTGDLSTGETFAAVDAFTTNCNAQCHTN
ncbi:MAG: hypothetical protein HKN56_02655 [Gammaproteobacteria bacterium]|nr:hypothetical protein [Gammaproteobacteria bacterium]